MTGKEGLEFYTTPRKQQVIGGLKMLLIFLLAVGMDLCIPYVYSLDSTAGQAGGWFGIFAILFGLATLSWE